MTDQSQFTNERECLEYYAGSGRDYLNDSLTAQLKQLGNIDWRATGYGEQIGFLTPKGMLLLEQLRHLETSRQLDAANKRIAELETICHDIIKTFSIEQIGEDWIKVYAHSLYRLGTARYATIERLLDTLPDVR